MGVYNLYNTYGECEGNHDTALTIEDGETLGALLSRVESRAQVYQLTKISESGTLAFVHNEVVESTPTLCSNVRPTSLAF
jgi:hypothetical protein